MNERKWTKKELIEGRTPDPEILKILVEIPEKTTPSEYIHWDETAQKVLESYGVTMADLDHGRKQTFIQNLLRRFNSLYRSIFRFWPTSTCPRCKGIPF